jgi:hypothetical protein
MKKSLVLILIVAGLLLVPVAVASAASMNGVAGAMPVLYDGNQLTMNFKLMPAAAQTPIHDRNGQINVVYQSDSTPGFISVVDAIPGDGMNPLWEEWQITFNDPAQAHQLGSDTEILAAAAAGTITLTDTDEMYRCSLIGKPMTW